MQDVEVDTNEAASKDASIALNGEVLDGGGGHS